MTTIEQWEKMTYEANAAAVKAMAEADRLRAELAALRAAGGPSDADVMKWVTEHPYFGDWDTWAPIAYDRIPVLPRMALSHLYGRHAERESPFAHCVFCELFDLRAAGGQEKPQPVSDPYKLLDEVERIVKFEAGPNDVYMRADVLSVIRQVRAAAPVGGQAEPSDAQIDADLALDGFDPKDRYPEHGHDALRTAYRSGWESAGMAAAAVSGEQS